MELSSSTLRRWGNERGDVRCLPSGQARLQLWSKTCQNSGRLHHKLGDIPIPRLFEYPDLNQLTVGDVVGARKKQPGGGTVHTQPRRMNRGTREAPPLWHRGR